MILKLRRKESFVVSVSFSVIIPADFPLTQGGVSVTQDMNAYIGDVFDVTSRC